MGKLVSFEQRRRPIRTRSVEATTNGQILIFTGVRYERGVVLVPKDPGTPARSKRKRG